MPAKHFTIETLWREMQLFILMSLYTSLREPAHARNIALHFGRVVDCIEDKKLQPAPLKVLQAPFGKKHITFGTAVCRNCDARFSCDSYRQFAAGSRLRKEAPFKQCMEDHSTELDLQMAFQWVETPASLVE